TNQHLHSLPAQFQLLPGLLKNQGAELDAPCTFSLPRQPVRHQVHGDMRRQSDCGDAFDGLLWGQLPVEMAEPLPYQLLGGGMSKRQRTLALEIFRGTPVKETLQRGCTQVIYT
ncbi:hypothetical protein B0H10DRAFT_2335839, partial [Mycena sp. CBHHK59/15]